MSAKPINTYVKKLEYRGCVLTVEVKYNKNPVGCHVRWQTSTFTDYPSGFIFKEVSGHNARSPCYVQPLSDLPKFYDTLVEAFENHVDTSKKEEEDLLNTLDNRGFSLKNRSWFYRLISDWLSLKGGGKCGP